MDAVITITGLEDIQRKLNQLSNLSQTATKTALARCVLVARREAVRNAPIAPTQSQQNKAMVLWHPVNGNANMLYRRNSSGERITRSRGRKASASSRPMPGGLEKSIDMWSDEREACVFVPRNSPAGKYATVIHDKKGVRWRNRGIGTQMKGARADDKFIERAIFDNTDNFKKIIDSEIRKEIHK